MYSARSYKKCSGISSQSNGEDQECQNKEVYESNYENTQQVGVSNITSQEGTSDSIDNAMGTEKLENGEKQKMFKFSFRKKSLLQGEKVLHINKQPAESSLLQ